MLGGLPLEEEAPELRAPCNLEPRPQRRVRGTPHADPKTDAELKHLHLGVLRYAVRDRDDAERALPKLRLGRPGAHGALLPERRLREPERGGSVAGRGLSIGEPKTRNAVLEASCHAAQLDRLDGLALRLRRPTSQGRSRAAFPLSSVDAQVFHDCRGSNGHLVAHHGLLELVREAWMRRSESGFRADAKLGRNKAISQAAHERRRVLHKALFALGNNGLRKVVNE